MNRIDLNADIGEGFGVYKLGHDEALLKVVSSANIACGFHAGDPVQMCRAVELCMKNGVAVGAHPGYPDLLGFGRRVMDFNPAEIKSMIIYQAGALSAIAKSLGGTVEHVKPHGALYNLAARDRETANAVVEAVLSLDGPALIGLAGSELVRLARDRGVNVVEEGFADRNYNSDGSLVTRKLSGAIISNPEEIADRVLRMVRERKVTSLDGEEIYLNVDTICVHGDNESVVSIAGQIRHVLERNGISVVNPAEKR